MGTLSALGVWGLKQSLELGTLEGAGGIRQSQPSLPRVVWDPRVPSTRDP